MKHHLRFRQVHLDFHTAGSIPDVGAGFDPEAFAQMLEDAHVDSITCFSRCHHGWFYYDSKRFPERIHPNLKDKDMLKKQIEACHRHNIKVPVYTTVQWDEQIAKEHRDWLVIGPNGGPFRQEEFKPGFYRNLCLNTGYVDYLKEQVQDIFECLGHLDGLFLDILNIQPCCCPTCVKEMQERGLDPVNEEVRYEFAQEVMDRFEKEMTEFIHQIQPDCPVFYNAGFLSTRQRKTVDYVTHYEIESLPGGSWGYDHFPVTARYARTLDMDFLGMTGKFHLDWGDFGSLRNQTALEYECFKSLALGGKCSIGDQLHPNGQLWAPAYELIGNVYSQVEEKEPWCDNVTPVAEVGIFAPVEFRNAGTLLMTDELNGAVKLFTEIGIQFNIIDTKEDFSKYRLLVMPDYIPYDDVLNEKIQKYIDNGGKILASYHSGMDISEKKAAAWMPAEYIEEAPYSPDFMVAREPLSKGLYENTEYVMYQNAAKVSVRENAEEVLPVNVPYYNRTWDNYCSHRYFPSSGKYGYPGVVKNDSVIYFAHPVFSTFQVYGCRWIKTFVENATDMLLKERIITYEGPRNLEVMVNDQIEENRSIVHFLYYVPSHSSTELDILEDTVPLYNIPVSFQERDKKVKSVRLVPQNTEIEYTEKEGRITFTVPEVFGHQMVEIHY